MEIDDFLKDPVKFLQSAASLPKEEALKLFIKLSAQSELRLTEEKMKLQNLKGKDEKDKS